MPKSVTQDVARSLRQRIAAGEWRQSRQLPNERELAQEYRVARNTMRRAIDAMVSEGAITRHVGRGTFLAEADPDDFSGIMTRIAGTSPLDIMQVRMIVEPQAAATAAAHASESDLAAIAEAHEMAKAALETISFEQWDAEFHKRIFVSTRNEFLTNLHDILRLIRNRAPWLELKRRTFSEQRRQDYCAQHAAIIAALGARDGDGASAAMRTHLEAVHRNLFGAARIL